MNSLQISSADASQSRSWNVEMFEFQQPTVRVDAVLSSAPLARTRRAPGNVKLVFDLRLAEGRRLMEEDERDLGPVSKDVLNEVRSRWPV